jgi:ubiquinone biosynthesis protein Coq4
MFDKARIALASYRLFKDPTRLDEVLTAAEKLSIPRLKRAVAALRETSGVAAIALDERFDLPIDLETLKTMPPGSLGRAVYDHCTRWNIDPKDFPKRPRNTPEEFVVAHLQGSHDVWHAVTGFDSDVPGEIGLQAFYLAQFPAFLALLLIAIMNMRILGGEEALYPALYDQLARGWLLGKRAKPLFGVKWHTLWDRPLSEIRAELQIDVEAAIRDVGPERAIPSIQAPAYA